MSHCMGVRCAVCREVIIADDQCPEHGCPGGHGLTSEAPQYYTDHECADRGGKPT